MDDWVDDQTDGQRQFPHFFKEIVGDNKCDAKDKWLQDIYGYLSCGMFNAKVSSTDEPLPFCSTNKLHDGEIIFNMLL